MQQTETYKLNKPETTDPFTPAPLNENADKLDAALADVSQRVIKLEGCRIVAGSYFGTGHSETQAITLGGRPLILLLANPALSINGGWFGMGMRDSGIGLSSGNPPKKMVIFTDDGFTATSNFNQERDYCFLAFMGSWPTVDVPKPTA